MTTAQRPIVKGKEGANRGHTRNCAHPGYVECLMIRHNIEMKDKTFAQIMGGCDYHCHFDANRVHIPHGAWVPPGQVAPIGTLHAIRLEKIEEAKTAEEDTWLL